MTVGEDTTSTMGGNDATEGADATDTANPGEGTDGAPKFDLPSTPDAGAMECGNGEGAFEFSYIWIANSAEGTVSKIDTVTGVEEGRYATGPMHPDGSPSRTSVNQFGDAVVVNRGPGGIAKIAASEADCVDRNLSGVIDTSTGAEDVMPWMEDECVLWYLDVPSPDHESGPRPVAWEGVQLDDNGCATSVPRIWLAWRDAANTAHVWRLDGTDGTQLDEVLIANWPSGTGRPYGGAVNAAGDFWMTSKNDDPRAVRIDANTLLWEDVWQNPAGSIYGMAVDQNGDVWGGLNTGSMSHYRAAIDTWTAIPVPGHTSLRGIMADREGRVWGAAIGSCGLVGVDAVTDTVIADIDLPGCQTPVGISIDADGFVWVVDRDANRAYKVNPDTNDVELTVTGLNEPYTYSDMTGAGLGLVINPPG